MLYYIQEIKNATYESDEWKKINDKYRTKFAEDLQPFETNQITNDEGLIFFAGDENSAIHSEPKMDKQRMFISILPTTKEEIEIRLEKIKNVNLMEYGWVNKVSKE